jgi:hypothetical protein
MGEIKPCATCGKPTNRILFRHSPDEVAICSKNCQTKYFETMSAEKANMLQVVISIDERIADVRKYEMCCWMAAGFGLLIIILGTYLARTLPASQARTGSDMFLIGAVPLTLGAIAAEHFSAMRRKLMAKRRQVV